MTWICPTCGRTFRNKHQDHSCAVTPIETHLNNKPAHIVRLFEILSNYILGIDRSIRRISVKNAILFATVGNFIALKPRTRWLEIEFNLEREMDVFPIHKTLKITKYKYCHFLRIDDEEDINQQLYDWLREAYEVSIK